MDELAHAAGQDPLEFRRKLMAKHPKHLGVLNAVAERIGWGKPAPQGVFRGLAQHDGLRQLCGGSRRNLRRRWQQDQDPPHRRQRPIRASRSIRRRSSGRSQARSSTACRRCSTANARSRTAPSSRRTSTPTTRCVSPRCRRSNRSSCRPAARLGRRRRADDLRGCAGGAQRVLRGDRQAHPLGPAEEPQHNLRVNNRSGGPSAAASPLDIDP